MVEFCEQKDMKISYFAKKIGIGQSIIYKWNRGEANPNCSAIMSIKIFFSRIEYELAFVRRGRNAQKINKHPKWLAQKISKL
jgi:predicted transcriptional regulator